MKPRNGKHDTAICTEWETSCHRVRAAIRSRYKAGETVEFLAEDYEMTIGQINHILFGRVG